MNGPMNFNTSGALDHIRGRAMAFVTQAAITVDRRAKELLSVPGTAFKSTFTGKHKKPYGGGRLDDQVTSKPGEPPRKQTGRLRASVTYEVDEREMSARVGTNLLYGKALELGTKKGLAPRPWLRRALFETASKVNELLGQIKP